MSVMIVTSLGDIVVDLHTDRCPLTTKNFLKLCKIKYFNGCLFHTVQKDFTAQTGDPMGKGTGGDSIYKILYGDQARFFGDEILPDLKHSKTGTVAMASAGENLNASQFYFTLRDDLDYLDGKHTVFGEVAEGMDTLMRINEAYLDEKGRPYKNIRIKHTYILVDPFEDPPQLAELIPERSPEGKPPDEMIDVRLEDDWVPMDETLGPSELEEALRLKEAQSNAVFLETIGDIPDAEIKPPENVLFVCKLNPVTQDEDLDTIFSRFGTVLSTEIIRDYKTGDSLCYAFIEFETTEACEQAYFKMDNALIDDRRIHVDFSQSVAKLWSQYRRGKGGQSGEGRGCFKCGALDHIAKDCTEDSNTKKQNPTYILKEGNTQRGGEAHQSYEMVFEGDTLPSLDHEKKQREHRTEDEGKRLKTDNSLTFKDLRHRDHRKVDSGNDRGRHDYRDRGHREESAQGTRSGRDDGYHGRRYSETRSEKQRDEGNQERDNDHHQRQDKHDHRKKNNNVHTHSPRREDRDDRKRQKDGYGNIHEWGEQDDDKRRYGDGSRDSRHDRGRTDRDGEQEDSKRRYRDGSHDSRHKRGRTDGDGERDEERGMHRSSDPHKREDGNRRREVVLAAERDGRDDGKRSKDGESISARSHRHERRR